MSNNVCVTCGELIGQKCFCINERPAVRYRMYTQNKNIKMIKRVFEPHFDSYTLFETKGVWNGKSEKSLCIEIIADENDLDTLQAIGQDIKLHNNQEAVLITHENLKEVWL